MANSVTDLMNISELNHAELNIKKNDEEKCDEVKAEVVEVAIAQQKAAAIQDTQVPESTKCCSVGYLLPRLTIIIIIMTSVSLIIAYPDKV